MHPGATRTGGDATPTGATDEFDTWLALQRATDDTRANLIADIVGHPAGAPSVAELDYTNPSLGTDAIRRHLGILQDVGVVEQRVVEPGERVRGYPYTFYAITDAARALFDRNDLFPVAAWRRQYDRIEKTSEIRDLESMPRPE
ncbi:helix-turn-helix domain-containing protein [Halococcoides cellulosivorans]|uniref:Transcriptional regulator n=1 Tax=Halococcoides cellulosivorans TaxID=1679096 RepID=A0A2R4X490_9EURY|nr:transcriptional regulator [Halococcoides cellulosivorans]AWB28616.1 transcriptional regulator [Halococcoides cellulosivorans]